MEDMTLEQLQTLDAAGGLPGRWHAVAVSDVVAPCLTDDEPTDAVPPTPFVHVSVAVVALLAALPTANASTV